MLISVLLFLYGPESWRDRWTVSEHKSDYGKFEWTAGKFYGDAEKDKGMDDVILLHH